MVHSILLINLPELFFNSFLSIISWNWAFWFIFSILLLWVQQAYTTVSSCPILRNMRIKSMLSRNRYLINIVQLKRWWMIVSTKDLSKTETKLKLALTQVYKINRWDKASIWDREQPKTCETFLSYQLTKYLFYGVII